MKTKKNLVMTALVYLIVFGVYNMLVFVIFRTRSDVFWIAYAFTVVAFIVQVASMYLAFKNTSVETVFFGMPLASFSVFYLVAQICVGAVFMIFQGVGTTIPIVIQLLVLAAYLVVAIIAIMARDTVQAIGEDIKQKVVQHKSLNVDVDTLLAGCSNPELKAKLRKLSETIKYSDPMTTAAIADVDQRIAYKLSELRVYCENNAVGEATQACSALELLFVERNKKLMLSK